MDILTSASKFVFVLLAITACIGFVIGKLPVDSFMILVTGAFAFYFSNKGNADNNYLGK